MEKLKIYLEGGLTNLTLKYDKERDDIKNVFKINEDEDFVQLGERHYLILNGFVGDRSVESDKSDFEQFSSTLNTFVRCIMSGIPKNLSKEMRKKEVTKIGNGKNFLFYVIRKPCENILNVLIAISGFGKAGEKGSTSEHDKIQSTLDILIENNKSKWNGFEIKAKFIPFSRREDKLSISQSELFSKFSDNLNRANNNLTRIGLLDKLLVADISINRHTLNTLYHHYKNADFIDKFKTTREIFEKLKRKMGKETQKNLTPITMKILYNLARTNIGETPTTKDFYMNRYIDYFNDQNYRIHIKNPNTQQISEETFEIISEELKAYEECLTNLWILFADIDVFRVIQYQSRCSEDNLIYYLNNNLKILKESGTHYMFSIEKQDVYETEISIRPPCTFCMSHFPLEYATTAEGRLCLNNLEFIEKEELCEKFKNQNIILPEMLFFFRYYEEKDLINIFKTLTEDVFVKFFQTEISVMLKQDAEKSNENIKKMSTKLYNEYYINLQSDLECRTTNEILAKLDAEICKTGVYQSLNADKFYEIFLSVMQTNLPDIFDRNSSNSFGLYKELYSKVIEFAVCNNMIELLRILDISLYEPGNDELLYLAASCNNCEVIEHLDKITDISAFPAYLTIKDTALHTAIRNDFSESVSMLLELKNKNKIENNMYEESGDGLSAVQIAATLKNKYIFELLEKSEKENEVFLCHLLEKDILFSSVEFSTLNVVEHIWSLLKNAKSIQHENILKRKSDGSSLIEIASKRSDFEIFEFVLNTIYATIYADKTNDCLFNDVKYDFTMAISFAVSSPSILRMLLDAIDSRKLPLDFIDRKTELYTFNMLSVFGEIKFIEEIFSHKYSSTKLTSNSEDDEEMFPLHSCVSFENEKVVNCLLKYVDVNAKWRGYPALHCAIERGMVKNVEALLEDEKISIDETYADGQTHLHLAADLGHKEIVEALIKKKFDVNSKTNEGATPLHCAARINHYEIVELLCENKANLDCQTYLNSLDTSPMITPLSIAVKKGNLKIVKYLLEKGANPYTKDFMFRTPLHEAAEYCFFEAVELLLDYYFRERETEDDVIKEFNDYINARMVDGHTALHFAASKGDLKIVKLLITYGADATITDLGDKTPLGSAIYEYINISENNQSERDKYMKIIEYLLNNEKKFNLYKMSRARQLFMATEIGDVNLAKLILNLSNFRMNLQSEYCAKQELTNTKKDNITVLQLAVQNGHQEVAEILIAEKADTCVMYNGNSLVDIARTKEIVELLKKYGVKSKRNKIATPMHLLGKDNNLKMFRFVIMFNQANNQLSPVEVGKNAIVHKKDNPLSYQELIELIDEFDDTFFYGIIVEMQLDAESQIDSNKVTNSVSADRDFNSLSVESQGMVAVGDLTGFLPYNVKGVLELIDSAIELDGKKIVVVTSEKLRSFEDLTDFNWTVKFFHTKTDNLRDICATADVLVVAIGQAEFVKADFIKPGAVVIDCGINLVEDCEIENSRRLVGDVAFDECSEIASHVMPVLGGVGPMTVTILMKNTAATAFLPAPSANPISRSQKPKIMKALVEEIGLLPSELSLYGNFKAKIHLDAFKRLNKQPDGKYIVVDDIAPTPLDEGQSTTLIGLVQSLKAYQMKNSFACLRYNTKGRIVGGGYSQVIPMEDFSPIIIDNVRKIRIIDRLISAKLGRPLNHNTYKEVFKLSLQEVNGIRVFSEDQLLVLKEKGIEQDDPLLFSPKEMEKFVRMDVDPKKVVLQGAWDIIDRFFEEMIESQAQNESTSIVKIANNLEDMKKRLSDIVVAYSRCGKPVTVDDLGVTEDLMACLKNVIQPTLMQTLKGTPVMVYAGVFGNIANSVYSILADMIALKLVGDEGYVVTEAGFGSDIGMEKFFNIKCRASGKIPNAIVLVATVRALKMHGGGPEVVSGAPLKPEYTRENLELVERGLCNLIQHIENGKKYGIPVIVAINSHKNDTKAEHYLIKAAALANGAFACVTANHWAEGGKGAVNLSAAVIDACEQK